MKLQNIILGFTCLLFASALQSQQVTDWLTVGNTNFRFGDFNTALYNYNLYVEDSPKDPLGYLYRARLLEAIGQTRESQLDLQIARNLNPLAQMVFSSDLRSKYSAKKLYDYKFGDADGPFGKSPTRTENYLQVLRQLDDNHAWDTIMVSAISAIADFELDEAEDLLAKVQVNETNEAVLLDLSGKIAMKREDYDKAIGLFSEAIAVDPNFSIAYHNRSICHHLKGNDVLAEKDLKRAIQIHDDIALFYFSMAKLNEEKGNIDIALENYKNAIETDKDYAEALINYSQLLKGLGNYKEGISYLTNAIDDVDGIENTFLNANMNFIYGEYEKALSGYETYIYKNPTDPDALYNKGLSLLLLRNNVEGCNSIENALQIAPKEDRLKLYNLFCDNSGI